MQGNGNKSKAAEPLESSDIERALGDKDPETLQNTIWCLLTLHMGMRGREEHYQIMYADIEVKSASDGIKFVEFNERDTKHLQEKPQISVLSILKCGVHLMTQNTVQFGCLRNM